MGNQANVTDHLTTEQLEAGLEHIRQSPADGGPLLMIVRRPDTDEREVVEEAALDVDVGLVGDNWKARGSPRTPDGKANPEAQITMMNSRLLALLAQSEERWPLAGDQLVIDMDLSVDNLPPGRGCQSDRRWWRYRQSRIRGARSSKTASAGTH